MAAIPPPQSAIPFIAQIEEQIEAAGVGRISTLCGRYWSMDRDNRWDRTEKAYRLLTEATDCSDLGPRQAIESAYASGIHDEFIEPVRFSSDVLSPGDGLAFSTSDPTGPAS